MMAIYKQIVIDMAYQEGLQINTIVIVDTPPEIRSESFGATYDHYLQGLFWSRAWVAKGADPNAILGDWPVLFAEQRTIEQECPDSIDVDVPWNFALIDKIECATCPTQENRTPPIVKNNTLRMLRAFIQELYTFQKWTVDKGSGTVEEWISEGRLQHYTSEPGITPIALQEDLASMVGVAPLTYREWGNFPDLRGYFTTMTFTICPTVGLTFNYKETNFEELATAICDNC